LPFLRNLFYRQFSRIMVRIKSPITIPGGYKLHLPPNGIDYIIEPYEELETELIRKNLKEGDTFLDIGGGNWVLHSNCFKNSRRQGKGNCF